MEFTIEELEHGIKKFNLAGRMDILGTGDIDLKFTSKGASKKAYIVVDLSGVEFMTSIGLRTLASTAQAQNSRGGKITLAAPQPLVRRVLAITGSDKIIDTYDTVDDAKAALLKLIEAEG